MNKHRLIRRLKGREPVVVKFRGFTRAAVFVPLFQKGGTWHLLLTSRTNKVHHHKNQVSFPGGVFDTSDGNLLTTALRETEEEIGIKTTDIEVWGKLDDTPTPTRFLITPYVGTFPYPYRFRPNAVEIQQILQIPIREFVHARPTIQKMQFFGHTHEIPFYQSKGHWIWGATGRILRQLASLIEE